MFGSRIQPSDSIQGQLSNCYLISSIAAIAEIPELIKRLINTKDGIFNGLFSVNLNINGVFTEIVVDGFVPVNASGNPKFCRTKSNYLYPLILEKAYAKNFEAYWNIGTAGAPSRALKDLTGAPTEVYYIQKHSLDEIFQVIIEAEMCGFVMVVTSGKSRKTVEEKLGIQPFHAYTILEGLTLNGEKVVKLRNPSGNTEWKGDWGYGSKKWTKQLIKKFDLDNLPYGTFFMPLKKFKKNFTELSICNYRRDYILSQLPVTKDRLKGIKCYSIKVSCDGDYYICFSQPDKRYIKVKGKRMLYTSVVLLQVQNPGTKKSPSIVKYCGGKASVERDSFFRARLKAGEYLFVVSRLQSPFSSFLIDLLPFLDKCSQGLQGEHSGLCGSLRPSEGPDSGGRAQDGGCVQMAQIGDSGSM